MNVHAQKKSSPSFRAARALSEGYEFCLEGELFIDGCRRLLRRRILLRCRCRIRLLHRRLCLGWRRRELRRDGLRCGCRGIGSICRRHFPCRHTVVPPPVVLAALDVDFHRIEPVGIHRVSVDIVVEEVEGHGLGISVVRPQYVGTLAPAFTRCLRHALLYRKSIDYCSFDFHVFECLFICYLPVEP